MSIDRKRVLERRSRAMAILDDQDSPPELRKQAKVLVDQSDVLLGLQEAQDRRQQRSEQPEQ